MSSVYGRQFVDVGENLDDSLAFVRLLILSNPTCTQKRLCKCLFCAHTVRPSAISQCKRRTDLRLVNIGIL